MAVSPRVRGGRKASSGWKNYVKGWIATHDVEVELQFVPIQDYIGGSKLPTAFAAGHGPDIFIISPGDFLHYYNGGVLADLTSYMEDAAKKDFFPNVMETRIVDEKIYGVPMGVMPMAMYYSVKAFEEAGLSESDIPKTCQKPTGRVPLLECRCSARVLIQRRFGLGSNGRWKRRLS